MSKWLSLFCAIVLLQFSLNSQAQPYSMGREVNSWWQYLSGKHLASRSSNDAGTKQEDYYLCSNGDFMHSDGRSNHSSSGGVSMNSNMNNSRNGHWYIRPVNGRVHIIFDYRDGDNEAVLPENNDGRILLNGTPFFVVENNRCR